MSTSPADDPTPDQVPDLAPGVVAFTARGDAALDELAAALTAGCDGSTESITAVLEQVLGSDIHALATALSATAAASAARVTHARAGVDETTPGESPDQAARRRMGADRAGQPRPARLPYRLPAISGEDSGTRRARRAGCRRRVRR